MRKIKRSDGKLDVGSGTSEWKLELVVCRDPSFLSTICFFRFYSYSRKTVKKCI